MGTDAGSDSSSEEMLDAGAMALLGNVASMASVGNVASMGSVPSVGGGQAPTPDTRRDTLTARAYSHPALPERTVVRLATEPLGPAEDLVMDYLGFDPPGRAATAVGIVRRQALGFPAWVLVHDPGNKQHALNLVKEIERCARLAGTKPGHAKDGFDAAAATLAASVPHFLPTFYEQAARAFLAVENTGIAATMFGKAREAERAHGLPVDEDALTESYVEFALAGALSGKALSGYSRELSGRVAADEAFRRFRRVCVERITGGLPPYAAMQADLRRLAKAAKLDLSEAEQDLLRELLPLPALTKARQPFWHGYRAALIDLARADPAVRGRLLDQVPVTPEVGVFESDDFWLGVLAESGADTGLTEPEDTLPPETLPRDGAAAWLAGFASRHGGPSRYPVDWPRPVLFDLVRRMAPRLRAKGVPVRLAEATTSSATLLDYCLTMGIDVADPAPGFTIFPGQLSAIRSDAEPDLSALAADTRFQPALQAAMDVILAERQFNPGHLMKTAGPRRIHSDWLDRAALGLHDGGGTVDAEHLLSMLTRLADLDLAPALAELNPAAWAKIESFDPAVHLAHAVRSGIPDEFGWPTLEAACAQLTPAHSTAHADGPRTLRVVEQWPYLIVADQAKAAVLAHDAVVLWQDLAPLPSPHGNQLGLRWTEGQLSITSGPYHDAFVTWSGAPHRKIRIQSPDSLVRTPMSGSIELPDGSRTFGGRPYRAGDELCTWLGHVATDGHQYWVLRRGKASYLRRSAVGEKWRAFDPFTGTVGEHSLPEFFARATTSADGPDVRLLDEGCTLIPIPPQAAASPLGHAAGLAGWRLTVDTTGIQSGAGIDGRTIRLEQPPRSFQHADRPTVVGTVRFPGAREDVALVWHYSESTAESRTITLVTRGGRTIARVNAGEVGPIHAHGSTCVLPWQYWHFLTPRDPAGSAALREIRVQDARALLRGAATDEIGDIIARVRQHLPQITDDRLRLGVAGFVWHALHSAGQLAKIKAKAAAAEGVKAALPLPTAAGPTPASRETAEAQRKQIRDIRLADQARLIRYIAGPATQPIPENALSTPQSTLPTFLRSADEAPELAGLSVFQAWLRLPSNLYLAASAPWFGDSFTSLLDVPEILDAGGLLARPDHVRLLIIRPDSPAVAPEVIATASGHVVTLKRRGNNTIAKALTEWWAVEVRREGDEFGDVPGWTIVEDQRMPRWPWPGTGPAKFGRLLAERGELPWLPQSAERLAAATGMNNGEAAVILLGFHGFTGSIFETISADHRTRFDFRTSAAYDVAARRFTDLGEHRNELLGELLPATAEEWWTTGPDVDRAARWWIARYGCQTPVPEELSLAAAAELFHSRTGFLFGPNLATCLRDLLDEDGLARLSTRPDLANDDFELIARTLLWLAYRLPTGSHLRTHLPAAARVIRSRLTEPGRDYHVWYAPGPQVAAAALGVQLTQDADGRQVVGPLRFRRDVPVRPDLLPSLLTGLDDPVLDLVAEGDPYGNEINQVTILRLLLGDDLEKLLEHGRPVEAAESAAGAERAERTEAAENAEVAEAADGTEPMEPYPAQDPTRSVPNLVTEVSGTLGISPDAAALYLMLLALPDPTDRNQATWTGWKPARLKSARADLAATDFVVTGSRARAGRGLFLPGGWSALKTPHLPVETWKLATFGIRPDGTVPSGVVRPLIPVPELFHTAWQRVRDGDGPRLLDRSTGSAGAPARS